MKQYYYGDNNQQLGPFSLEELRDKKITKSTLVWFEGLDNWVTADKVEELKSILVILPPPLPVIEKNITNTISFTNLKKDDKHTPLYDSNYQKETEATIVGIILFFTPVIIAATGFLKFDNLESYNDAKIWVAISSLTIRIVVTIWVVGIAERQNRSSNNWGWFTFLLPSIALIIIGQLRKLRLKMNIDNSLSIEQQTKILLVKARNLFSDSRHIECIEVINKILEIDNENYEAFRIRAISFYEMNNLKEAFRDFMQLHSSNEYLEETNFYLGNINFMNKNFEEAIEFWDKAKSLGNEDASTQLSRYWDFRGKYFLTREELSKKLNIKILIKTDSSFKILLGTKYINGIEEFDNIEKRDKFKEEIFVNKFGIAIQFSSILKKYFVGISFTEIKNIIFEKNSTTLIFEFFDNKKLYFEYNDKLDSNHVLKFIIKQKIW